MPLYFLAAEGLPLIRIGASQFPIRRFRSMDALSPVRLRLAAVDECGDFLTEAELHWRLREYLSHASWYFDAPAVRSTVARTKETGSVPDGWYAPTRATRGIAFSDMSSRFRIRGTDYVRIIGKKSANSSKSWGIPFVAIPPLVEYLRGQGHQISYRDLLEAAHIAAPPAEASAA